MSDTEHFNEVYENESKPEVVDNKWALRNRLRSKVLWVGVAAKLITIFTVIGLLKKYNITPTVAETIAYSIISILELFGVINDPTNHNGF